MPPAGSLDRGVTQCSADGLFAELFVEHNRCDGSNRAVHGSAEMSAEEVAREMPTEEVERLVTFHAVH